MLVPVALMGERVVPIYVPLWRWVGDKVDDKPAWCFAQCASLHVSLNDARNLLVLHRHPCAHLKKIGSMLTKDQMRASPSSPTLIKGNLGLPLYPQSGSLFSPDLVSSSALFHPSRKVVELMAQRGPSFSDSQNELDFFNLEDQGSVKERSLLKKEEISCNKSILGMDGLGKVFLAYVAHTRELGVVLQSQIKTISFYSNKKVEI